MGRSGVFGIAAQVRRALEAEGTETEQAAVAWTTNHHLPRSSKESAE